MTRAPTGPDRSPPGPLATRGLCLGLLAFAPLASTAARAPASPTAEPKVRGALGGSIAGVAMLGTALASLIPVDTTTRWRAQLLPCEADLTLPLRRRYCLGQPRRAVG